MPASPLAASGSPVALLGSGSWATALARVMARGGHRLHWWVHRPADAEAIRHTGRNPRYLSSAEVPAGQLEVFTDIQACLQGCQVVWVVVPSAYVAEAVAPLSPKDFTGKILASAIKGLELHTGQEMAVYFGQRLGLAPDQYVAVTGPSHAEEVAQERITYLTLASASTHAAAEVAALLQAHYIYTHLSTDVEGLEYAAVMKNIYAVSIGLALGLGYGDNFVAVLVAACLGELERYLQQQLPGMLRTVTVSGYAGDLLVTAYSVHSRNRQLGQLVGRGQTPTEALAHMQMVAEGYYAAQLLGSRPELAGLPIAQAVYQILHRAADPKAMFRALEPLFS